MTEKTDDDQPAHLFKPGQSGNPSGRPKGSRNKLGEAFIAALHEDFKVNGKVAIETVRAEKPDQYLKVIAAVVPKEVHLKDAALEHLSDDELDFLTALARQAVEDPAFAGGGEEAQGRTH